MIMSGRWTDIVVGVAVVGFGLILVLFGSGDSVTTCFDSSCTTDPTSVVTAFVFLISGVVGVLLVDERFGVPDRFAATFVRLPL